MPGSDHSLAGAVMARLSTTAAAVTLLSLLLHGCAALPLTMVGGSVLQAGTGTVVKSGTEYTMAGTARRTLTVPVNAVRAAVLEAFDRVGAGVVRDEASDDGMRMRGQLERRTIDVRLTPLSSSLTAMTLVVKRNLLLRDRATTSEILEQIDQALAENSAFARRLRRPPTGEVAAGPP
jgi:hypothetical protein